MGHYAKVVDGIVTEVIVADKAFIDEWKTGETWIKTSYNTLNGVHVDPETREPDGGVAIRGNFAGPGMIYDSENDVFYNAQPHPSWTLNKTTWQWDCPIGPFPDDGYIYKWDEDAYQADNTTGWVRI